ncbi:MAG: class I SAM-dependent methyltransferase [bacterium]|nr:class I SAM-dependent methyltransferase [bacterium]
MSNNDPTIKQYEKLAKSYDFRFPSYLNATTDKVVAMANIAPGSKILDLGCGTGELLFKLAQKYPANVEFVGIDISEEMLKQAKSKLDSFKSVSLHSGDIEQVSYPDEYFDLIVSIGVMHYIQNPKIMTKEAFRVLKREGSYMLIDMAQESLTTKIFSFLRRIESGAKQFYSLNSISELLSSQGFKICFSELFKAGMYGLYFIKTKKQ